MSGGVYAQWTMINLTSALFIEPTFWDQLLGVEKAMLLAPIGICGLVIFLRFLYSGWKRPSEYQGEDAASLTSNIFWRSAVTNRALGLNYDNFTTRGGDVEIRRVSGLALRHGIRELVLFVLIRDAFARKVGGICFFKP